MPGLLLFLRTRGHREYRAVSRKEAHTSSRDSRKGPPEADVGCEYTTTLTDEDKEREHSTTEKQQRKRKYGGGHNSGNKKAKTNN